MKKTILFPVSFFALLTIALLAAPVFAKENPKASHRLEAIEAVSEKLHEKASQNALDAIEKNYEKFGGEEDGDHHMMTIEAIEPIPTIDLIVHQDPKAGYNLEVVTTNYKFAPEHASTQHIDGEGHAHLYVDGEKLTRVYGNWFYLGALDPGEHTIRVELSANNHSAYAHEGVLIDDTEIVVVE